MGNRMDHRREVTSRRRQLVDRHARRRRQAPALDHCTGLKLAQPGGKGIGADAGQPGLEVHEALRTRKKLADDQHRPALSDDVERAGNRAVLVVEAFGHCRWDV
jgi:hypothetical protein